jgi:hypothetical protein
VTWPEATAIAIIGGAALFQGGLLAIRYIERHEVQEVIMPAF